MIKLQCPCGMLLQLPPNLAGQQVRCKRCNKVLKVPAHGSGPDAKAALSESGRQRLEQELLVQGSRPCPGCGRMYPPSMVVCVDCGLNIASGAMLYASVEDAPTGEGPATAPRKELTLWQRVKRALGLGK